SWENFPHTVVEALAAGTPVLATATGGVAEVVYDGENGLLVPVGDAGALAGAIRRFFDDDELRGRLRAAAAGSVADYAPERVFAQLEETLLRTLRR
ncbi:MAG: glycosyltransferase, partial [Actinomycetota bacterium]